MAEINLWDDCDKVRFRYDVHITQFLQRQKVTKGYAAETMRLPDGTTVLVRNALSAFQQDCRFEMDDFINSMIPR